MKLINLNRKKVGIDLMGVCNAAYFPFRSDLTANFNSRTDLTLSDSIAGETAAIVGSEIAVNGGTGYISTPDSTLIKTATGAGQARTILIGMKTTEVGNKVILEKGLNLDFVIQMSGTPGFISFRTNTLSSANVLSNTAINDNTYRDFAFIHTGTQNKMYVNSVLQTDVKSETAPADNTNPITFGSRLGVAGPIASYDYLLIYNRVLTNQEIIYATDRSFPISGCVLAEYLNGHSYDSISGLAATNVSVTFALDKDVSPQPGLKNGYVDKSALQIINHSLNTSAVVGYNRMHLGGKLHNDISSFVRFPLGGFFDRSNVTIWNANARSSIYYDSLKPTDFHISELNQYSISNLLNVGYKGKFFNHFTVNSIDNRDFAKAFLLYGTDKTFDDEIRVLRYTKDIAKAVDDGLGSYVTDANGYVVLTP